ncbi:hypothetical protein [Pedobacter miscanthi]|jgi:hypothetical protein|uniref:hypothetical protein n=1 Tax=Pedobacter miscanthi TaxID=2259170 RepID=UPI0029319B00|nr:hypothetical protein [Pedobacter miscanthi]
MHFRLARPKHHISVLIKSGLTNFSGSTDPAILLTLKEKFSAGGFCFFLAAKRKSLSAAASRGKTVHAAKCNKLFLEMMVGEKKSLQVQSNPIANG